MKTTTKNNNSVFLCSPSCPGVLGLKACTTSAWLGILPFNSWNFVLIGTGVEAKTLQILSKGFTTEPHHQPYLLFLETESY